MKINPREKIIYGWENPKIIEKVVSLMIGIIKGNDIPLVGLNTSDDEKQDGFNGNEKKLMV